MSGHGFRRFWIGKGLPFVDLGEGLVNEIFIVESFV
jgi:hypothetical protein